MATDATVTGDLSATQILLDTTNEDILFRRTGASELTIDDNAGGVATVDLAPAGTGGTLKTSNVEFKTLGATTSNIAASAEGMTVTNPASAGNAFIHVDGSIRAQAVGFRRTRTSQSIPTGIGSFTTIASYDAVSAPNFESDPGSGGRFTFSAIAGTSTISGTGVNGGEGQYMVIANVAWAISGVGTRRTVRLTLNGGQLIADERIPNGTFAINQHLSTPADLVDTDVLTLQVIQDSGGALDCTATFSMIKIA